MADRRDFFEELIFRSMGSERFTQASPILPDVWLTYGLDPVGRHEVLMTPCRGSSPMELARRLRHQLGVERATGTAPDGTDIWDAPPAESDEDNERRLHSQHLAIWGEDDARVAFHQSAVVADLSFYELIRIVLPMSRWWHETLVDPSGDLADIDEWFREDPEQFGADLIGALLDPTYRDWVVADDGIKAKPISSSLVWLVRVIGTIAWLAERHHRDKEFFSLWDGMSAADLKAETQDEPGSTARTKDVVGAMVRLLEWSKKHLPTDGGPPDPLVEQVNNNRAGQVSIYDSAKAVKGDAVRQLFSVRGRSVRWAVIDSGIDAGHVAFRKRDRDGAPLGPGEQPLEVGEGGVIIPDDTDTSSAGGAFVHVTQGGSRPGQKKISKWVNQTRIEATYDFTRLRKLLSADPDELTTSADDPEIAEIVTRARAVVQARGDQFRDYQKSLRQSLKFGSQIDWDLLAPLLQIPHDADYEPPAHHHGTHVAGIIGADWRAGEHALSPAVDRTGLAPEIRLYDLRALDADGTGTEFDIMGALQFVRHLNSRKTSPNDLAIHGANLSFSLKHDVSNFACGRTPVCEEAERLIGDGIVVVAAAGNQGRARYTTAAGMDEEGYRSISITDPGNAAGVITVGATHRREPHKYGVSYFSSRGPTGDGRSKPDLVAPGEKIYSTVPGQGERDLDGTSMAAPHVSGAAALLMERNFELVGQPQRVKEVLCASATDLGREPYFQGAGMLDVLRALQSV